jgi:hypothetical protein
VSRGQSDHSCPRRVRSPFPSRSRLSPPREQRLHGQFGGHPRNRILLHTWLSSQVATISRRSHLTRSGLLTLRIGNERSWRILTSSSHRKLLAKRILTLSSCSKKIVSEGSTSSFGQLISITRQDRLGALLSLTSAVSSGMSNTVASATYNAS